MNCLSPIKSVSPIIPVWFSIFIFIFAISFSTAAEAQVKEQEEDLPSAKRAFLRSLVVPGWGHYYVDNENWTRGKYHLAGEVVLVLSYFGLDARADNLENDFITLALSKARTDLSGKKRDYLIAVGNYDDLDSYNEAQIRTRNWDQLYPETAEYQWSWENRDLRNQYRNTRERVDKHRSQLPTLLALMAANRLFSGLSAFVRARDKWENAPEAKLSYFNEFGEPGFTAVLRFNF
ncbi:MAG: hypothetical protein HUJ22_05655 [Gracilimonas sp.]|uniref:hypothetical protein n=1 Tax=Gracilimonas sp. TaxID=1974203 RepID=UPI0019A350A2|nr:hypothetical protein [Gracilimonas sp.]MBD3616040.1 hypothetical protein [Gracilimonas sp.]